MNEQLLLDKWQILEPDEQQQVLAFIDAICHRKQAEKTSDLVYQPQTELGQKLWAIRQKIKQNPEIKLLTLDEINQELDEIRGKTR